jgi:hypothetical protein
MNAISDADITPVKDLLLLAELLFDSERTTIIKAFYWIAAWQSQFI